MVPGERLQESGGCWYVIKSQTCPRRHAPPALR